MHIKDHARAEGWFRKHAAAPSSVGSWKAFVARNKTAQEPRTMAQEPRNMYAGGQLVQNTVDGSRPGYGGGAVKKLLMAFVENFKKANPGKLPTQTEILKATGAGSKKIKNLLNEGTDFIVTPRKDVATAAGLKSGAKKKELAGSVSEVSSDLIKEVNATHKKGMAVSIESSTYGSQFIRLRLTDNAIKIFGEEWLPATKANLEKIKTKIKKIEKSPEYKNVEPFKTAEYFRKLNNLKRARYKKQDPFRIYEKLQEYKTEKFPGTMSSDIQIQHGQPKFTTQTLSRWGLIPKNVQTIEPVVRTEKIRNELLSQALVKLKNPNHSIADKKKIIGEFNNAMRGLRGQLKGTEGQGLVNFELLKLDEAGNVVKLKDVGFNPKKGLAYGDKLGELDFAKISQEQADQIIDLGKKKIDLELLRKVLPRKLKNIVNPTLNYESGGRVGLSAGGWLASLFGAEALIFEYAFYEASKRNFISQGYSEEEAKAMAIDEASWGITNKSDPAYNKELDKVAKEMGLDSKAFDTIREISERNIKVGKERERDEQLLESDYFKTEEAKNKFLDKREKLYGDYNEEIEKLWRKAKTEIGMDKAGKVFPTPNLDQIATESMNQEDADVQNAFGDLQKVATEKLRRRKLKAFDVQSKQVETDQGTTGNLITDNLWNLQSIPRTLKTAYDLINPFSPLPKLDDLKSDAALEQAEIEKMDNKELYLYNKRRGIEKDNPITPESLEEIQSKYPELQLRGGGIASLMKKKW